MDIEKERFLNKDVTIRKVNETYVRGTCVKTSSNGITLRMENNKEIFIPYTIISELIASGD